VGLFHGDIISLAAQTILGRLSSVPALRYSDLCDFADVEMPALRLEMLRRGLRGLAWILRDGLVVGVVGTTGVQTASRGWRRRWERCGWSIGGWQERSMSEGEGAPRPPACPARRAR
jgi:hypothetical protein